MSIARMITFLAVSCGLTGALHYYIWARLVRDPGLPAPWYRVATVALTLLAIALPLSFVMVRAASRSVASAFSWVAYTWMGVMFFLVVSLAAFDVARALASTFAGAPPDDERRQAIARVFAGIVAVLVTGLSAAGLASGLARVAVKKLRIPLPRLPQALAGYRIVQLTDIHVGPTIGRGFIEDLVARTNALEPDLIAITGDLVDGSVAELAHHVEPLSRLRAKDGVFFVTGNHEYYSGADAWIAYLASIGIRVLRNEHVPIRGAGAEGFDLAGVDDATAHQFGDGHGMDVARATEGRDPSRLLVLLAHQPKAVHAAERAGVDLQLSGHTHGGQLFPFNFLVKLQQPYVAGLFDHGRTKLYVSRGTGYWGPPMRLGAPAEITEIALHGV